MSHRNITDRQSSGHRIRTDHIRSGLRPPIGETTVERIPSPRSELPPFAGMQESIWYFELEPAASHLLPATGWRP